MKRPNLKGGADWSDADYIAHFRSKTVLTERGCWQWYKDLGRGPRGPYYPQGGYRGKRPQLNRLMLALTQRPLEPHEKACHRCDNPLCINPDHLWIGTQKENIQDAIAKGHQQFHPSHYTHCKHGHEFTPENTWLTKEGYRHCKECQRIKQRRRYRENPQRHNQRHRERIARKKQQQSAQNGKGDV